jgi:SAM-dependent methyltransferase
MEADRFAEWVGTSERRHLAELTFPEVSRALRALSSAYVERRHRLDAGTALVGAGKRAAFALFYAPLHFLLVRHVVESLQVAAPRPSAVVDLGCGTGAAGAALAAAFPAGSEPPVTAVDRNAWAAGEARETYRAFGLRARVRIGDAARTVLPRRSAVIAAFTVNELGADARSRLLNVLVSHAKDGGSVLIVEPVAGFVAPWWGEWRRAFEEAGGRADEWRLAADLPPIVAKLDRAAGMNHREITGRSLFLSPPGSAFRRADKSG